MTAMNINLTTMYTIIALTSFGLTQASVCHAKTGSEPLVTVPLRVLLNDPAAVSAQGREISVRTRRSIPAQRYLLVQGGIHGDEKAAQEFVVWLSEKYSRGDSLLNELDHRGIAVDFLPYSNPDGIFNHQRSNHSGVNLNRNFGVLWGLTRENPGKSQFSEPETAAIKSLFRERKYLSAVDVHGYVNWVVGPSDAKAVGHEKSQTERGRYLAWSRALTRGVTSLPGYEMKTAAQLGDGGAFEDWAFWDQHSYAFCLELKTAERYSSADSITEQTRNLRTDTFLNYEKFIFLMFRQALDIKEQTDLVAPTGPAQPIDS
jgi:hypothetical protein